jgi:hypothetical protein
MRSPRSWPSTRRVGDSVEPDRAVAVEPRHDSRIAPKKKAPDDCRPRPHPLVRALNITSAVMLHYQSVTPHHALTFVNRAAVG